MTPNPMLAGVRLRRPGDAPVPAWDPDEARALVRRVVEREGTSDRRVDSGLEAEFDAAVVREDMAATRVAAYRITRQLAGDPKHVWRVHPPEKNPAQPHEPGGVACPL